jgi:hypothetical protein
VTSLHPIIWLSVLLAVGCLRQGLDADTHAPKTEEYRSAYQQGRDEADKEVSNGVATLYSFGLRLSLDFVDRETGLPIDAIAGCVVDDSILGRALGHNERIREHIKAHGLPANSFKPWEKQLFGLKEYVGVQEKVKPIELVLGGPTVKSPDGKYAIRPVHGHLPNRDGRTRDCLAIIISVDGVSLKELLMIHPDKVSLVWGPPASRFAVVYVRDPEYEEYAAIDLQRGRFLREEFDRKEKRHRAFGTEQPPTEKGSSKL